MQKFSGETVSMAIHNGSIQVFKEPVAQIPHFKRRVIENPETKKQVDPELITTLDFALYKACVNVLATGQASMYFKDPEKKRISQAPDCTLLIENSPIEGNTYVIDSQMTILLNSLFRSQIKNLQGASPHVKKLS